MTSDIFYVPDLGIINRLPDFIRESLEDPGLVASLPFEKQPRPTIVISGALALMSYKFFMSDGERSGGKTAIAMLNLRRMERGTDTGVAGASTLDNYRFCQYVVLAPTDEELAMLTELTYAGGDFAKAYSVGDQLVMRAVQRYAQMQANERHNLSGFGRPTDAPAEKVRNWIGHIAVITEKSEVEFLAWASGCKVWRCDRTSFADLPWEKR